MTTVHPFSDAPVLFLIGYGFRPAYMPADYIGPRLDCPMWLPAPDADVAYLGGKYDAPAGHGFGFVLWPDTAPAASQITAASLAGVVPGATPHLPWPIDPWQPETPCCVIREPDYPLPPVEPVPVPASGVLLIVAIVGLGIIRGRRA